MTKQLVFIHGRNFKPSKPELEEIWYAALRHGLFRDFGDNKAKQFDDVDKQLVYYGDHSNKFLEKHGEQYDAQADLADRRSALEALKVWDDAAFVGDTGRSNYENLPGKSSIRETLADIGDRWPFTALSERVVSRALPDMRQYWNSDAEFGSTVRWEMTEPLAKALGEDQDILILSHSLGTIITYDVLWKFSYYGEWQQIREKKVSVWVTLGSPLGDETTKRNLKGASASGARKFPHNVVQWINVAAEDDYVSHDETLADDYRKMQNWEMVDSIDDHRIYNLAVRNGKSNPHHGAGYLIHPTVSKIVSDWLGS